jgi:hypothetical protein
MEEIDKLRVENEVLRLRLWQLENMLSPQQIVELGSRMGRPIWYEYDGFMREPASDNEVNMYRCQWEQDIEDNFGLIMPLTIFRVTWTEDGEQREYWTHDEQDAGKKKYEIDHTAGFEYRNFEGWFAYRFEEHDKRFGYLRRNCDVWWK